jgi:hypothetical protein
LGQDMKGQHIRHMLSNVRVKNTSRY